MDKLLRLKQVHVPTLTFPAVFAKVRCARRKLRASTTPRLVPPLVLVWITRVVTLGDRRSYSPRGRRRV